LLPQRSKHPREMVITPKASTLIYGSLFVGVPFDSPTDVLEMFLRVIQKMTTPYLLTVDASQLDVSMKQVFLFKGALQLLINRYGSLRFAQVPERVSTTSFVVLIIGNSKSFHLGAQSTSKGGLTR